MKVRRVTRSLNDEVIVTTWPELSGLTGVIGIGTERRTIVNLRMYAPELRALERELHGLATKLEAHELARKGGS